MLILKVVVASKPIGGNIFITPAWIFEGDSRDIKNVAITCIVVLALTDTFTERICMLY